MRVFGLIGKKLEHSFSEKYFSQKFILEGIHDARYFLFPIPSIQEFPELISGTKNLYGLGVTIPYKEDVINYMDELDTSAEKARAVNVVKISRRGKDVMLKGYNTDMYGFEKSLRSLITESHKKALIFGTGGASKAVQAALKEMEIPFLLVSRSGKGDMHYSELSSDTISSHAIVVNTTPLGMFPDSESFPPIPYEGFSENHIAFDLVYNPEETTFMKKAAEFGATVENGYDMLRFQADRAWEIWNE